jgi:hypothetical protein
MEGEGGIGVENQGGEALKIKWVSYRSLGLTNTDERVYFPTGLCLRLHPLWIVI